MRSQLCLFYRKHLEAGARVPALPHPFLTCQPCSTSLAWAEFFSPQTTFMPACPQSHCCLGWPRTHLCVPLGHPWRSCGSCSRSCLCLPPISLLERDERRVENGDMRGAATKKDSLDSFVPPVWSVCHLSGAVMRLTFGGDELVTRAAGMRH